jgi:molybdopterin-guanine dinucleotide biosynthesis protein A
VTEAGDGRLAEVAGAVLLGGASARMGRDKARLEMDGVAAATRLARRLSALFEEVLLVGGEAPADAPGCRVPDVEGPACALRGLVSALAAARAPRVLVVATDLPLLRADLLLALLAWPETAVVLPETPEGLQPLCALYARETVLPAARARLSRGELALHALVAEVGSARLAPADLALVDPSGLSLLNVNTPADLSRAQALLREGGI